MRLGLMMGYSGRTLDPAVVERVLEAERLGFDSCWTSEAYGSDAVTPLAWVGALTRRIRLGTAVMQAPARTPAMCAMTAMTLDALSGGRFALGLGPSGPQVVEGWHGLPYGPGLARLREYVAIVRAILRREAPLEFHGRHFELPYRGPGASGLGKPLKSILHGRADMRIYTAALAPAGVRLAAEVADGFFPLWLDPERFGALYGEAMREGRARAGRGLEDFDVLPIVRVVAGDDLARCLARVKPGLALYIGGMGSREKNFYREHAARLGFAEAAERVQSLFLEGRREEAAAAVPDALADAVALCGPRARIAERLARWRALPLHTLCVESDELETLRMMAELAL